MAKRNFDLTTTDSKTGNSINLENKTLVENGYKKINFNIHILKESNVAFSKTHTLAENLYPYLDILKATFYGILDENGSVDVELSASENRVKSFIPYPAMPGTFFTDIDQIKYGDWVCKFAEFIVLMMFLEGFVVGYTVESTQIQLLDEDCNFEDRFKNFYDSKITEHENRLTMNVEKVIKYFEILVDFSNTYIKNNNNDNYNNDNNNNSNNNDKGE